MKNAGRIGHLSSQPIAEPTKLVSIRETSHGSILNLTLPGPLPLSFLEASRSSVKNSDADIRSSSSPLTSRHQLATSTTQNRNSAELSKKHSSLQPSPEVEKDRQSLQKLMQETSNLR